MRPSFSGKTRQAFLEAASHEAYDVIIIGGGVTGAGCLWEATRRGYRALLLEREDFASETSSKSSKLIHGGLRYLETLNLPLVFEALRSRADLLRDRSDLVSTLPFLFPVFEGQRRSLATIACGVWIYEALSFFRSPHLPRVFLKKSTQARLPQLRKEGLKGAALYYDAVTHDARLTLDHISEAYRMGGMALNYAEVNDLLKEDQKFCGVNFVDRFSGRQISLRSSWIVNSTGPFSDRLLSKWLSRPISRLRTTKGVHIVLPRNRLRLESAVVMLSSTDGRVTFAIPWEDVTLVGTTDTEYPAEANTTPLPTKDDVQYLLRVANDYFPSSNFTASDVISTFAGLRPLIHESEPNPSNVSREHKIFIESEGLLTISGGKLTTFRSMARDVLNTLEKRTLSRSAPQADLPHARRPQIGTGGNPDEQIFRFAIENQMAMTICDILARRTSALWTRADHGRPFLGLITDLLMNILGTSPEEISKQIRHYEAQVIASRAGLI